MMKLHKNVLDKFLMDGDSIKLVVLIIFGKYDINNKDLRILFYQN
jgi:hypothetical protein